MPGKNNVWHALGFKTIIALIRVVCHKFVYSENDRVISFFFCLGDLLKVLIDNSYSEEDTSTRTDGSHEICKDWKQSNAESTESSSNINISAKIFDHRSFTLTFKHHVLLHQLACDILGTTARDIDPDTSEESARTAHKCYVEDSMEGISLDVKQISRWWDIVSETTDRCLMASHIVLLPLSNERDEVVVSELLVKNLREEVQVTYEGSLEDNWNIWGIEQLNREGLSMSTHFLWGHHKLDFESLEIDND